MALSALKTAITSKVGIQSLVVRKHSPAILLGVGVVGMGATVYLACRATLQMDEVLREAEAKRAEIKAALEIGSPEFTEEDAKKEGMARRVQLAIKIAKMYAPAVAVGTVTLVAMTGSYHILNKRNAGITAAYAAVDKGFREYRARVIEEQGEDKDREYRFGKVEKVIGVDTDEGIVEKTIETPDPEYAEKSGGRSMYARIFDRESSRNWQSQPGRNATFLRVQQQWANDMLTGNGFLLLNDVYHMLGMKKTSAGAVVGWVKNNKRGGDSYVSFGIAVDDYDAMRFISGDEDAVWLDFNVDGVVYDLIGNGEEE
jgi:hypothetical protein